MAGKAADLGGDVVVDPEGAAQKAYLASLADKLGLDADLVAHLRAKAATLQAA